MKDWEKKLAHARAVRDATVAMGNAAPTRPDPPGGLVEVRMLRFNGPLFREFLAERGHDYADWDVCKCQYAEPDNSTK